MPMPKLRTLQSDLARVQRYVLRIRSLLDSRGYYPRLGVYADSVFLSLFSKSIRVSETICALVGDGFNEEAFGMTRTLLDLLITVRFIANKKTERRAERFFNFLARDTVSWLGIIQTHYPGKPLPPMPDLPKILKTASTYPDPHRWAGSGMSAYTLAMEPSTWEFDDIGEPLTLQFWYDAVFHWTSHFVHPTIAALESHVVKAGKDIFTVHARANILPHKYGELTLFNTANMLGQVVCQFFHGMNDNLPERYRRYGEALSRSFVR